MKRRLRVPVEISRGAAQNQEIISRTVLCFAMFQAVCSHMAIWCGFEFPSGKFAALQTTFSTQVPRFSKENMEKEAELTQNAHSNGNSYSLTIIEPSSIKKNSKWSFLKGGGYGSYRKQDVKTMHSTMKGSKSSITNEGLSHSGHSYWAFLAFLTALHSEPTSSRTQD